MNLDPIGVKHGTDKSSISHDYLKYYARHMPASPKRILEIGCELGESLRMWREVYPNTEIHTIDLFEDPKHISKEDIEKEGFIAWKGDQFYKKTYDQLTGKFDVIIEDGSHNAPHQLFSFNMLFINFLAPEGLYVMEDLHCNQDPFYWGQIKDFDDTPLASMERKGSWFYCVYGQFIHSIDIYDRKIAFIKKRIC